MIEKADVAIIGGGIMGASAAFHISKDTNLKVTLLEKGQLASGSTGRSAAIIRHYYSNEVMLQSAIKSRNVFQNFKEAVGEPLEFVQNTFIILDTGDPAKTAPRRVKEMRRFGLKADTLSNDEVRRRFPFLVIADDEVASFDEEAGFVPDPSEATRIYARQATKRGARVYENVEVKGIRHGSGVQSVVTSQGEIKVDYVLNTAGPWGQNVSRMVGLDFPIQPIRQQLIDFTIPGGWPITRPTVSDRKNITYLKPSKGGIAHTGGHYFGKPCDPDNFDEGIDEEFRKDVTPKLESRFPELKKGKIATGFSGLYEDTPDKMPLVGETEVKGFILCAGWSGHGFKHGPFFGVLLKELIQGGRTSLDISAFDPGRFKSGKLITTDYAKRGDKIPPAPYS